MLNDASIKSLKGNRHNSRTKFNDETEHRTRTKGTLVKKGQPCSPHEIKSFHKLDVKYNDSAQLFAKMAEEWSD